MVSHYQGVVQCIKDDFLHFCNPAYLKVNEHGIFNIYYHFGFNHESPGHANLYLTEGWPEGTNHFVNNHFRHFIDRYNQRIQSFRNYLANPENHITFIIQFVDVWITRPKKWFENIFYVLITHTYSGISYMNFNFYIQL